MKLYETLNGELQYNTVNIILKTPTHAALFSPNTRYAKPVDLVGERISSNGRDFEVS